MEQTQIRLVQPYIRFEEIADDFQGIFESGFFTKGKHVAHFAQELCAYTGAKHAFLTTSATTALWTCLKVLNIQPGDEVIVSDFSFPASVNVIEDLGATPIFADVSLETFNMLPEDLEAKITKKTKAVMFIDALGNPAGIQKIGAICKKHNIPLIEDAACAIGSEENGQKCGNIADLTCFSFHPRKIVNTGEGGAITTNNDAYAAQLAILLNHGASGMKGLALDFVQFGYNFRMSELQAAMGRKQLEKLDSIVQERNECRTEYQKSLESLGFHAQQFPTNGKSNAQSVVFRVPEHIQRNDLVKYLATKGIESTIGTYCLSRSTYYLNKYNQVQPNSATLEDITITLPCYSGLDVERINTAIREMCVSN